MSVHIKKGTPIHGPSLCETCMYAQIVQGYRESDSFTLCHATYDQPFRVTFAVRECSRYINQIRDTLCEMEKIAWTLAPRGSKRHAGFVAPGESKQDDSDIELVLNEEK
jgi:hypothetical protein